MATIFNLVGRTLQRTLVTTTTTLGATAEETIIGIVTGQAGAVLTALVGTVDISQLGNTPSGGACYAFIIHSSSTASITGGSIVWQAAFFKDTDINVL